jgi:uncharacterized protein YjbJ (UPF0337 family)
MVEAVFREDHMKPSIKNEVVGKAHELVGKIKETVGEMANDAKLETEGIIEKNAGQAQQKIAQLEKVVEKP